MRLVVLALVAAAALPGPAHAAASATFAVTPRAAAQNATLTLRGHVGRVGRVRVTFHFQRYGTIGFVPVAAATTTRRGTFAVRVPARATGTWRAAVPGTRDVTAQVVHRQPRQIASYGGKLSAWRGPSARLPRAGYRAVASYRCEGEGFLFLQRGREHAGSGRPAGTVVLTGRDGARRGFFEVSTWTDCVWSVRVYAGSVPVQV